VSSAADTQTGPDQAQGADAEWRDGWRAVVACGLGVATGLSLFAYLTSLFIAPYTAEFGWSRGDIAQSAFATLAAGLCAPVVGRLADRIGVRPTIVLGTAGFALACVGMAHQDGRLPTFYALYFLLVLSGIAAGSVTWTRPVVAGFHRHRGVALAVALSFVSVAAVLGPPFLKSVIEAQGWRAAWLALGALAVAGGLAGLVLLPGRLAARGSGARLQAGAATAGLAAAARSPAFHFAVLGMFLVNIPSGGIMNQMAAVLADAGLSGQALTNTMSAFGASVFVGRMAVGVCLDHFAAHRVAFVSMALPALGCVALALAAADGADAAASAAVLGLAVGGIVAAGLSQGAEGDIGPYIVARRFGLTAFSAVMGALVAATVVGTAAGAMLFGRTFDATGDYGLALWLGAGAFLAGAVCWLMVGAGVTPEPPALKPTDP